MLNIHSFLQGIKKYTTKAMESCGKASMLIVGYVLVAAVLLFSSNRSQDKSTHVIEAYAKVGDVTTFVRIQEETAKKANIRANQELDIITSIDMHSDIYSMGAMNGVAANAMDLVYEKQQAAEEEQARKLAQEKAEQKAKEENAKKEAEKKKAAKEKAEKEEAAKKKLVKEKAAKAKNAITLSDSEKEVLQRIVEAEATGEDLKGRVLVANVIMNRVKSKQFPDTVKGVVFQKNGRSVQFSPTRDGRYWSVKVTKKTKQAVDEALSGTDYSKGALYFSARSKADPSNMSWFDRNLTWLFQYGGHEFYK